jgi:hypothetical protein
MIEYPIMNSEFGKDLAKYRQNLTDQTRHGFAINCASIDPSFYWYLEHNGKKPSTVTVSRLADVFQIPLEEQSLFFLRGAGFKEQIITDALNVPKGILLSKFDSEDNARVGILIQRYMSGIYPSNQSLATDLEIDAAGLGRIIAGKRDIKRGIYIGTLEKLTQKLEIPQAKQAEFLLLGVAHPYPRVSTVLQALGARVED